jgi:hypothetical protein
MGICLDGPFEGENLSTANQIGCVVRVAPVAGAGVVINYEVVGLASNGRNARLSVVRQVG